jgi:hypothetical protein
MKLKDENKPANSQADDPNGVKASKEAIKQFLYCQVFNL